MVLSEASGFQGALTACAVFWATGKLENTETILQDMQDFLGEFNFFPTHFPCVSINKKLATFFRRLPECADTLG